MSYHLVFFLNFLSLLQNLSDLVSRITTPEFFFHEFFFLWFLVPSKHHSVFSPFSIFFSVPFYFLRYILLNIAQISLFPLYSRRNFSSYSHYISGCWFSVHVVCLFLFMFFFTLYMSVFSWFSLCPSCLYAHRYWASLFAWFNLFLFSCCCCIVCYSPLHRQQFEFCCLPLQRRR